MMCYVGISVFSSRVSRMDFSSRTLNNGECCQVGFVRCYAFYGGGRCYCDMRNDCDVENVFSCEGDSEVVSGPIESP